jgi:hypothetical protein
LGLVFGLLANQTYEIRVGWGNDLAFLKETCHVSAAQRPGSNDCSSVRSLSLNDDNGSLDIAILVNCTGWQLHFVWFCFATSFGGRLKIEDGGSRAYVILGRESS